MTLIVDFLLLAASGAACFYCWVLNTRIKTLTSTKDGLHSGIVALSQSADEMQTAMASTKNETENRSASLQQLLDEADKKIPELRELSLQIADISKNAVEETETATKNLVETLTPHIEDARAVSHQLLDALEAAAQNAKVESAAAETETGEDIIEAEELPDDTEENDDMEFAVYVDDEPATNSGEAA